MNSSPEIAVVGAGIVGLATAVAVSDSGERVVVYESRQPGSGQSAAESRLFRHLHEDMRLAEITREGRKLWSEWEERFGRELISRDGVITIGDPALELLSILDDIGGVDAHEIGPAEVSERLPILVNTDAPAILDPKGGAIRTRAAIEALSAELAGSLRSEEVISIRVTERETVEVRTGEGCAEHSRLIVCAGRGSAALARTVGLELPLEFGAHVRLAFAVKGESPAILSCLLDLSEGFGGSFVYGAPQRDNKTYSVGIADSAPGHEDGSIPDPEALATLAERTAAYVERALPGLEPEPVQYLHCHTTRLPWAEDGLGIWEHGPILFVAGNNLFKQAPALGRFAARAALGDRLDERLRPESELG